MATRKRIRAGRNSRYFIVAIIVVLLGAPITGFGSESLTGREIMLRVDERPDGDDRKTVSRMILVNKRGKKRERVMLSFSKDYGKDTKTLFYFRKPADVKGVGFLTFNYDDLSRDDDRWLYLPALKKVRRISGSSKNDYFMGSDFTYDDMGGRSVDEDSHQLIKEDTINGILCWVVESVSKDKDYMYSKVIRWIAQDSNVGVKAEYFDRQGDLIKTLTITDFKKHQGFWTVIKMVMKNHQEQHETVLEIDEIDYDSGLKDRLFKVSTLERGRIR